MMICIADQIIQPKNSDFWPQKMRVTVSIQYRAQV